MSETQLHAVLARAFILTGATGSGKSALGLELAESLNGELIAMDSMTLYRGLDIGTAKPSAADRARVPHHLLDLLDPWEAGNVAWWLSQALSSCEEIVGRGRVPIFVGGTPLYLKALLHGLSAAPPADLAIRQRWEAFAAEQGAERLHEQLAAVDPVTAARLHVNDIRRVVRALEIWSVTGQPMSVLPANWEAPPRAIPTVVLDWPREELYQRIEQRVDAMLAAGWLDEVRQLERLPQPLSKEARQALGYRELADHLNGHLTWEQAISHIKIKTRQFAKRQLTWFRSFPTLNWCPANRLHLVEQLREIWKTSTDSAIL